MLEASSTGDALAIMEEAAPELMIVDDEPPDAGGLELLNGVRNSGKSIPVAVVTANDTREFRNQCKTLGATCVVAKPVESQSFRIALGALLKNLSNGRPTA